MLLSRGPSPAPHACSEELSTARDRLRDGLKKLQDTHALVGSMRADLAHLQPELAAKSAATAELLVRVRCWAASVQLCRLCMLLSTLPDACMHACMQPPTRARNRTRAQVSADQEEAEQVKAVVGAEEAEVSGMQQRTQAIADDAKAELDEALPALAAAIDSLKALNKNDIVEIKSFPKPPPLVQMTMEAVCILKQEKPDWDTVRTCGRVQLCMHACMHGLATASWHACPMHARARAQAKRVLSDTNFMRSLEEFDKDAIPDAVMRKLRRYIDDPAFTPDAVGKQSRAALSLCMWVRAMEVYHRWVHCDCCCMHMHCALYIMHCPPAGMYALVHRQAGASARVACVLAGLPRWWSPSARSCARQSRRWRAPTSSWRRSRRR